MCVCVCASEFLTYYWFLTYSQPVRSKQKLVPSEHNMGKFSIQNRVAAATKNELPIQTEVDFKKPAVSAAFCLSLH